jgi:MFS family permease
MGISTSWMHVAALRSTERVGKGVRGPPRDAMVAEVTDKSIRGRAFGLHRAMDTTGAILGSVLALALILLLSGAVGDKYRAIIVLSAIPVVVAIFVLIVFVKEERKVRKPKERTFAMSFNALPRDVKVFFLVSSLLSIGATNLSFMILRGSGIGFSDLNLILLYILFNFVYAANSYGIGITSDIFGRRVMIVLGFGMCAFVQVLLAYAETWSMLIVISFLINGVFMAMTEGMQKAFVVDLVTSEMKGTALGIHYALVGLSTFMGGLIIGGLWTYIDPHYAFLMPAALIIAGLVAFIGIFGIKKGDISPT